MAAPAVQDPAVVIIPSPEIVSFIIMSIFVYFFLLSIIYLLFLLFVKFKVGNAFARQYYSILHTSPALVYRFYQDVSQLGRVGDGGAMGSTTSMDVSFFFYIFFVVFKSLHFVSACGDF